MNAFLKVCAITWVTWVLGLSACGGSAEDHATATPAAQVDVPIHPLPLSERN
ncbi:hypothetical protein [Limnohabitans sp.]|jgi:hypothetical protein|uniref:hypothetical protein n=1 Tax=Limnohabitans sp. TaxID=1907725 RepID=UPI00261E3051|nr:hypothetical protein [Limnohabitans sp.]